MQHRKQNHSLNQQAALADMTGHTDEQLLDLYKKGNREAFSAIFSRYQTPMLALAYYMLKDIPEAEDIVQEYFVDFWANRHKYVHVTSLRGFIRVGVKRRCINRLRTIQKRNELNVHYISMHQSERHINTLEEKEFRQRIYGAIDSLPAQAKTAFKEHYLEGKPHIEIAGKMKVKIQTVRNSISTTLKRLQKKLQNVH